MKINPRNISNFIANPPKDIVAVLIYGHHYGLIVEHSKKIASHYVDDLDNPFSVTLLTGDDIIKDKALLLDSAAAIPALGGIRLVRIHGVDDKCFSAIENLLSSPPPESVTIISCNENVNTKSKLVKLFNQNDKAASIGCYDDNRQSVRDIIQETFRHSQIKADYEVINWISEHIGADRLASRSEIEKLTLLAGQGGVLTLKQVQHALGDGVNVTISDVIHAAANGNMQSLSTALERIQQESVASEALLRSGQRYFKRLFTMAVTLEKGAQIDQVLKSVSPPVFFSEQQIVKNHLRNWHSTRCQQAITRLLQAEKQTRQGLPQYTITAQAFMALALFARR